MEFITRILDYTIRGSIRKMLLTCEIRIFRTIPLEELGDIKSELAAHKNITLGKRYYVQVKPT